MSPSNELDRLEIEGRARQPTLGAFAGFVLGFLAPLFVYDPPTPRHAWTVSLASAVVVAGLFALAGHVVNRRVSPLCAGPFLVFGAITCVPWFEHVKTGEMLPLGTVYVNPGGPWGTVLFWHLLATALLSLLLCGTAHLISGWLNQVQSNR